MPNLYQLIAIVLLGGGLAPAAATADGPPAKPDPAQVRARIPQLLLDLDSPRFEVRQRAVGEVESWLARAELSKLLADEFSRRLVDPHLSYEVRWRLERWSSRLPPAALPPAGHAAPEELDRLIGQLDDDNFAVRTGAARRIQWLSGNLRLVGPLLVRLKRHLADPAISDEARERLEPLRDQVRGRGSPPTRRNGSSRRSRSSRFAAGSTT